MKTMLKARLETTLLLSRRGLTRPYRRYYSSPSKPREGPSTATATVERHDFPPSMASSSSGPADMESFLKRGLPSTFLPSPRPENSSSNTNDLWFMDTLTQDQLAIMDACMHNLYDVPRAKGIFDRMRLGKNNHALESRIYNAILEAYAKMAESRSDQTEKSYWLECFWELYSVMESGKEKVAPTASTYANVLWAWHKFHATTGIPAQAETESFTAANFLTSIVDRDIELSYILSDRVFSSSEVVADVIKMLSRTAVDLNMSRTVAELGQTEAIGTQTVDPLEDVPEAMPVLKEVKPQGEEGEDAEPRYEVPFNLDNLRRHLAEVSFARRVLPEDVAARQKLLEESVYDVAVERLKREAETMEEIGLDPKIRDTGLKRWMWEWHLKLKTRLQTEIRNIAAFEQSNHIGMLLSPYLSLVQAERLSLITILEIMRMTGAGGITAGMKTTRALIAVGRAVEIEYKAQMCKKNNIYLPNPGKPGKGGYFSALGYGFLQERRVVAARYMEDGEPWTATWSQATRAKIGGILVECLMDVAQVTRTKLDAAGIEISAEQPAFYHTYEHVRGQKLGVIRLNPIVAERLETDDVRATLHPRHLPMLVKPKPWLNYEDGGYFYNKTSAMRFKDSVEQQFYLRHASDKGNVELVYAGLDVLGSTPWKINDKIFHVVLKVWNSGERLGKMPPAKYDAEEPVPKPDMNQMERSVFQQKLKEYNQSKANNHSDRCSVNYKIEIARAFLGDTFYQPHNVDFRGRAYPIPPHLNHVGDDLSRGLLMFAEAKPLGERGLRWLKIQLAGLYGYDKASFDDRVAWVHDHMDDIVDSATNPLEGRRWWMKADDPWQCLACCIDLHAALQSPDPHAYESRIPVHQDGTCNGLQHYAALGGDAEGAAQVNLQAGQKPSDVYTYVKNMAEDIIAQDAERGNPQAQLLTGRITRKIVKQTVMTTVYGVTYVGARDQIERQLRLVEWVPEDVWGASAYLAKVVLACIGDLFAGAKAIQNWLNLCAMLISKGIPAERLPEALVEQQNSGNGPSTNLSLEKLKKEQMTAVVWTTPLGLPIVQPYRKVKRKQVMTALQTVFIDDPNSPAGVNGVKQASAFPPNFIHSLDATHMMLTALECRTRNITFASVHDSYWTHACSIDEMSTIIRDTFIALHSSEVLPKLRSEFLERYKDHRVPLALIFSQSLIKKLEAAGVEIVATPEQAAEMAVISRIVRVSDKPKESSITEEDPALTAAATEEARIQADTAVDELLDDLSDDDMDSPDIQREIRARKRAAENEKVLARIAGKFVNLSDLLPPLPKKGDFKVESIKQSPYFFS